MRTEMNAGLLIKYRLVETESQSAATCSRWFLARGFFYPEGGGDMFLEKSVHTRSTRRHIPKDGIRQI
jgi:hypothetical protein